MPKFRKKPVVIEAVKWDGHSRTVTPLAPWNNAIKPLEINDEGQCLIHTLEGTMTAEIDDWIIRGVQGELYPCKPDIFEQTYEPVEDQDVQPS